MAKHVIFLGAGASYTSGYPLAAELRVILSSPETFQKYVASKLDDPGLISELLETFKEYENLINLFREGGFGTIDEFSFLSRDRFKEGVQILKWFISLIFALHNPEIRYPKPGTSTGETTTAFENSDYFPFVQKLFNREYHELRDDVAITQRVLSHRELAATDLAVMALYAMRILPVLSMQNCNSSVFHLCSICG